MRRVAQRQLRSEVVAGASSELLRSAGFICVHSTISTQRRSIKSSPLGGWESLEDSLPTPLGRGAKGAGLPVSNVNLRVQLSNSKKRKANSKLRKRPVPKGLTSDGLRKELRLLKAMELQLKRPGAVHIGEPASSSDAAAADVTGSDATGTQQTTNHRGLSVKEKHFSVSNARRIASSVSNRADVEEEENHSTRSSANAHAPERFATSFKSVSEQGKTLLDASAAEEGSEPLARGLQPSPPLFSSQSSVDPALRRAHELATQHSKISTIDDDADAGTVAVRHGSTIFGSDLDRIESDFLASHRQQGKNLPKLDNIYQELGDGRRGKIVRKQPLHIFAEEYRAQQEASLRGADNSSEARAASIKESSLRGPRPAARSSGINLARHLAETEGVKWEDDACEEQQELPASSNPHFPTENDTMDTNDDHATSYTNGAVINPNVEEDQTTAAHVFSTNGTSGYDAYNPRPAEERLPVVRTSEYWVEDTHRRDLAQVMNYYERTNKHEELEDGPMDSSQVEYSANSIRRETLLYFQAHPINEMIQEPYVRIRTLLPADGSESIYFEPNTDTDVEVPVGRARRVAQELGLDLIRIGSRYSNTAGKRVIAECMIGDHREHMRDIIRFKMQKFGVQPPPTRQCIEVPFRGGTHPHAIRFKSIGIAKHLLLRFPVRINLTDFGTPREGFPVFQSILDEVKKQCLNLKAYHNAGAVQANYDEIYCYLKPSTGRSPKTTVRHPSAEEMDAVRDRRILENEREIYFDDYNGQPTAKDRLRYANKLARGLAWAEKDDGLSLQRQRSLKVMLGFIPKGNGEMYAARGDVNISSPFRSSHPTSVERWGHPPVTNLEQASRGAATLGKRAGMNVSDMHDSGETPDAPTVIDRFYYRVQGPALEVGEFKESLGLKDNRRKLPRMGPSWATLGVNSNGGEDPPTAAV